MEKYNQLINRLQVGQGIRKRIIKHEETASKSNCDKHNIGFNVDDRFSSVKIEIAVDDYTGFYGSSGVSGGYIVGQNDKKIFSEYFLKTLNKHFKELMFETADAIIADASKEKQEAIEDLEKALSSMKNLD